MAEIFVRNSLNSRKSIKINLALREFTNKGDQGESKWVIELGTTETTASGTVIPPQIVNNVTEGNIEDEIEKSISKICSYVDWGDFEADNESPYIKSFYPTGDNTPLNSILTMNIVEDLPSAGIDLSDAKIVFNNGVVNFDITEEIKVEGDPYDYRITWSPPIKQG